MVFQFGKKAAPANTRPRRRAACVPQATNGPHAPLSASEVRKRKSAAHPEGGKSTKPTSDATAKDFLRIADEAGMFQMDGSFREHRRWTSTFLFDPVVVAECWNRMNPLVDGEEDWFRRGVEPQHLLWSLKFLALYGKESELAKDICHEDTFRKWNWAMLECIAGLESDVVSSLFVYFLFFQSLFLPFPLI